MRQKKITVHDLAWSGLFSALVAIGAFLKVTIPVQPVPMHFTLQFFFVLLAGFFLGGRLGALSVITYLAIGLVGVPVFASGGGLSYLLKPTFGFLLGFVAAGYIAGKVANKTREPSLKRMLGAAFLGLAVMYLCGMLYFYLVSNYVLHVVVGWQVVFINCFLLTVWGDVVLCILAALLAKRLYPALKKGG